MMSGRKQLRILVLAFLVIVLAVGAVFRYTKAGDKIKDYVNPAFCVEYDGKDYTGRDNAIVLPTSGQAKFAVKGSESYQVKISPNVTEETDFTYAVGAEVYSFGRADISKVFLKGNSIQNGNLLLSCLESYALEDVLSILHDGAEITLNGSLEYPYLLTFTSENGETVTFIFGQSISITLSPEVIVF